LKKVVTLAAFLVVTAVVRAETSKVRMITLATGETVAFVFHGETPRPAETTIVACRRAGPEIFKEKDQNRFNWAFELGPRPGVDLSKVTRVTLEEVSGTSVVPLFSGAPSFENGTLMIIAPGEIVSRSQYPWLYTQEPSLFVFRIQVELPGRQPDVLLQPLLVSAKTKQDLKDTGFLR
jgi:hypothetical protein